VLTPAAVHRMAATTKGRTDTGELERVAQEGTAQAASIKVVITAGGRFGSEPDGVVRLVLVQELQGQHAAGTDFAAIVGVGLVNDAEAVALAQILHEVDLAAQDLDHLESDVVGDAGGIGGAEKRAVDFAFGHANLRVGNLFLLGSDEAAFAIGGHFQPAAEIAVFMASARRVIVAQRYQLPFVVEGGPDNAAGIKLVDGA